MERNRERKITKFLRFNTGRQYSKEGQIIEAQEYGTPYDDLDWFNPNEEQYVEFHDLTRQVNGRLHFCKLDQDAIMEHYDKGNYEQI
jgi:hypothetical protein